jgi:ParB family chromosome partitioning protein
MAKMGILKKTGAGTRDSGAVKFTVKDIPIGDISINSNVRAEYTDIDELTASIRQHGLLQPVTVYPERDGYALKTGHRRYMAYSASTSKKSIKISIDSSFYFAHVFSIGL